MDGSLGPHGQADTTDNQYKSLKGCPRGKSLRTKKRRELEAATESTDLPAIIYDPSKNIPDYDREIRPVKAHKLAGPDFSAAETRPLSPSVFSNPSPADTTARYTLPPIQPESENVNTLPGIPTIIGSIKKTPSADVEDQYVRPALTQPGTSDAISVSQDDLHIPTARTEAHENQPAQKVTRKTYPTTQLAKEAFHELVRRVSVTPEAISASPDDLHTPMARTEASGDQVVLRATLDARRAVEALHYAHRLVEAKNTEIKDLKAELEEHKVENASLQLLLLASKQA